MFSHLQKLYATGKEAQIRSGKSLVEQWSEILKLRYSSVQLGVDEYYKFCLFDDELWCNLERKREVVGWRREGYYNRKLNARPWNVLTGEKLVAYSAFRGLNLPHPKLFAVYHPYGRTVPEGKVLTSEEDLARFLREEIKFPFFSKPAHGSLGRNSVSVDSYDSDRDCLILGSGDAIPVDDYVPGCYPIKGHFPWESGFIFQECLQPDSRLVERFGNTVSSMRMICLNPDDSPALMRVVWKVPVGSNMTDNFDHGSSGNLIADIDIETGAVNRVVKGTGFNLAEVTVHPDTGSQFSGWKIPDWDSYVDICHRATSSFPGIRLQHWDIAITDRGPVILELNTFGDFDLPQLAAGRGMLSDELAAQIDKLAEIYPAYRGEGDY